MVSTRALVFPLILALACALALGCAGGTSAQRAVVAPTAVATAELAPASTGDRYRIEAAGSVVQVVGSDSVTGEHPARLPAMEGIITREGQALRVQLVLDMRELQADPDVQDQMRDTLLEVKRFPDCTFMSKAVVPAGEHAQVTGNLTLHGITRAITFDATVKSVGGAIDVVADFTLPRSQFDIHRHDGWDGLIHEDIRVHLAVHAVADPNAQPPTTVVAASAPTQAPPQPQPAPSAPPAPPPSTP